MRRFGLMDGKSDIFSSKGYRHMPLTLFYIVIWNANLSQRSHSLSHSHSLSLWWLVCARVLRPLSALYTFFFFSFRLYFTRAGAFYIANTTLNKRVISICIQILESILTITTYILYIGSLAGESTGNSALITPYIYIWLDAKGDKCIYIYIYRRVDKQQRFSLI